MANITVTPIKTFVSGETVTPAKLNELSQSTVALTAGSIVAADIASDAVTTAKILDANVTTAKLATVTAQALLPAGAVMPFARSTEPAGWLIADGGAVSRTTYADLFDAIGVVHGVGDGVSTFNLPNLQGIFVRGSGSQTIDGTVYNKAFASKQKDGIRAHNHRFRFNIIGLSGGDGAVGTPDGTGAHPYDLPMSPNLAADETRPANIALLYCIKF